MVELQCYLQAFNSMEAATHDQCNRILQISNQLNVLLGCTCNAACNSNREHDIFGLEAVDFDCEPVWIMIFMFVWATYDPIAIATVCKLAPHPINSILWTFDVTNTLTPNVHANFNGWWHLEVLHTSIPFFRSLIVQLQLLQGRHLQNSTSVVLIILLL